MVTQIEPKPMLTVRDVAELLHVHENTVRRWSDNEILKSYRITRRGDRRFRWEDISRFLNSYDEFNIKKSRNREPGPYKQEVAPVFQPRHELKPF